jgi:ABC-2 type transport system ATP-binding protein
VAITVTDLVHRFGGERGTRALDGVTFDVMHGETFGLLGPNGAGKTTCIRVIATLLRPDEGEATILGRNARSERMAVRRLLGYVPQKLSADADLTGYENVWLFARLFDVPRTERRERIRDVLGAMGLEGAADRMTGTYSGGMIRRLELAQALVNRPRVLVLDEPTIGLDPIARGSVWERVQELQRQTGMTVMLTTHYMDEADALCDRIALMHGGQVRALDSPAHLKSALQPDASLEDVFRHFTGDSLDETGNFRDVRSQRRTARRLA